MKSTDFLNEHNAFIAQDADEMHRDQEVQMARADLYNAADYAIKLHKILRGVSDTADMEQWVMEKIAVANENLRAVYEYLNYENKEQEGALPSFQFESADAKYEEMLGEAYSMADVQRDAQANARKTIDQATKPKEKTPFMAQVGKKIIGGVAGAVTGGIKGAAKGFGFTEGEGANTSHQHHVVSKLDGNVLASYKTKQEAHKNAHGNPVASGSLETIGDKQYVREQGVAEGEQSDLRKLQQQWWVALPAIMKKAGLDYQPVKELSRDYYPTLGWITIPGERFTTFDVNANPKGDAAKINISVDVDTSNEFYRTSQPERAAKLNAFAEKIAQALGGTAAEHMTGQRKNHPGVSRITATVQLPKEPAEWQNPSRSYDPKARFLNTPGERARQSRAARSGFPDSYGGDASNYRLEGVAKGFSLGKVLRFPEFVQQLSATLKQQDPNWHMSKQDDNVFLFSIPNDHGFYSMLIVAVTQPGWIEAAHGTVDPEGQPNVYSDKQHLPMTAASVSEVAREAISNYHALDFSDYDVEEGVAKGSDDNEPFDYEEWKASTVKPRKPRGHKEAELMIQQQKEINRKRKEQEQGVAESMTGGSTGASAMATGPVGAAAPMQRRSVKKESSRYANAMKTKKPNLGKGVY